MDADHWNEAYARLGPDGVSWFRTDQSPSLTLIGSLPEAPGSVVDIGGGASTLAGELIAAGLRDITVLDVSGSALGSARGALGARAGQVRWVTADLRSWAPDRTWHLWHDRAVFHFMADPADRAAYVRVLRAALCPGGHVIVATFAPDGPPTCSGLPVMRYTAGELMSALGDDLVLVEARHEVHVTPPGVRQPFTWVLARRRADPGQDNLK